MQIENLTVGYAGKPLLEGLSLSVEPGEIVTLLGPNGSGKSTILKTLLRQLRKISGEVLVCGFPLEKLSDHEAALAMAAVLTSRVRTEYMTAFDVVAQGRYPHTGSDGGLRKQDILCVEQSMERMQAADLGTSLFDRLSDGQKQRVLIARAMAQQPKILLLDEPMTHLDIRYQAELLSALKTLAKEQGTAILMSLHEIEPARRISDQVLCIRKDHSHFTGSPGEALTEEKIRSLFEIGEELTKWIRL